jgi:chromosome segregation ATPase
LAEDLELQKVTTIKQIKNDAVQERTALKQELRADQDKANDRHRKELSTTKDNLTKHQEVVRDLASKIEELHRSNEILQNYNDLPDLVESLQGEIESIKHIVDAKND